MARRWLLKGHGWWYEAADWIDSVENALSDKRGAVRAFGLLPKRDMAFLTDFPSTPLFCTLSVLLGCLEGTRSL